MLKKITIFMFTICFLFLFNIERAYAVDFDPGSSVGGLTRSGSKFTLSCGDITAVFTLNKIGDNNECKSDCGTAFGVYYDATNSKKVQKITKQLNAADGKSHYVLWGHSISVGTTAKITLSIDGSKKDCSGNITVNNANKGWDKKNDHLQANSSFIFELDVTAKETEKKENFTTTVLTNVESYGGCSFDVGCWSDGQYMGNYSMKVAGTTKALADDMTQYSKTGSEEDKKKAQQTASEKVTYSGGSKMSFSSTTLNDIAVNDSQKLDCDSTLQDFINKYWKYIMILAPVLLMVMITLDFSKALFSSDSDLIHKASTNAMKRVIATVILLCLPLIINTILSFFGLELCF